MPKKRRKSGIVCLVVLLLTAVLVFCCVSPKKARADVATDTLTIRVGYYGMDL